MFPGQSVFTEIGYQGFTPFVEKHAGGDDADEESVAAAKGGKHDDDGPGGPDDGPNGDDDDDIPDEGRGDPETPFAIYVTP
jgi:hypothetical protein